MCAVLKVKCHGLQTVGAFLERESAFFGNWLFLAKLTPAMPNLVEFCWGKEEESVIAISLARENHSGRFLGRFWVSSTFWSHWSRFQSH
jgi:hypothetical protein